MQLIAERDSHRNVLTAESACAEPHHRDGGLLLCERHLRLLRTWGVLGPPIEDWDRRVRATESTWPSTLHGLHVSVSRWDAEEQGQTRSELRARVPFADSPIMLRVMVAHLRQLGIDPEQDEPWLEESFT